MTNVATYIFCIGGSLEFKTKALRSYAFDGFVCYSYFESISLFPVS